MVTRISCLSLLNARIMCLHRGQQGLSGVFSTLDTHLVQRLPHQASRASLSSSEHSQYLGHLTAFACVFFPPGLLAVDRCYTFSYSIYNSPSFPTSFQSFYDCRKHARSEVSQSMGCKPQVPILAIYLMIHNSSDIPNEVGTK